MDSGQQLVVVGVDGSERSADALRYALADAGRRHARVWVVAVFEPPEHWGAAYGGLVPMTVADMRASVTKRVHEMLDRVVEEQPRLRAVPTEAKVLAGSPARVLVIMSREADLLVVGHRGHGAWASALLGSVGLHCVLHALCPVAVVRPPEGDGGHTRRGSGRVGRDPSPAEELDHDRERCR